MNTTRATTVRKDSADTFAHAESSETSMSGRGSRPFLSSAFAPSRQETPYKPDSVERPSRLEAPRVPPTHPQTNPYRPIVAVVDSDTAHAAAVADRLRARELTLTTHRTLEGALQVLRRDPSAWDIVVVNVSDSSQPWLANLRRLLEARANHSSLPTPLFLCTSRIKRDPLFQLSLERLGVRFVYER